MELIFRILLTILTIFLLSKINVWQTETRIYALFLVWLVFCGLGAILFIISAFVRPLFYEGLIVAIVPPIVFHLTSLKGHTTDYNDTVESIAQNALIAFVIWNLFWIIKGLIKLGQH